VYLAMRSVLPPKLTGEEEAVTAKTGLVKCCTATTLPAFTKTTRHSYLQPVN